MIILEHLWCTLILTTFGVHTTCTTQGGGGVGGRLLATKQHATTCANKQLLKSPHTYTKNAPLINILRLLEWLNVFFVGGTNHATRSLAGNPVNAGNRTRLENVETAGSLENVETAGWLETALWLGNFETTRSKLIRRTKKFEETEWKIPMSR